MIRTVVATEAFAGQTLEAETVGRRVDEFLEGAKWILARDPEVGLCVSPEKALHVLTMEELPDHPRLSLFYSIDYDRIMLLSLKAGADPERAAPTQADIST
jgi:hypothetical protein